MIDDELVEAGSSSWLSVVGRCLAFLTLESANRSGRLSTVLQKVDFLESLGLSTQDAAQIAGTTRASVRELRYQARKRENKASKNGSRKKTSKR